MSGARIRAVDSDVLEVVHAHGQTETNLGIVLAMRWDPFPARVRLGDDGAPLLRRHAFGEEHLDDVGTLIEKLSRLRSCVGRVGDWKELTGSARADPRQDLRERRSGGI